MPSMPLDVGDAIELAELLEFLGNWPTTTTSPRPWPGSSAAPPTASPHCARQDGPVALAAEAKAAVEVPGGRGHDGD